MAHLPSYHPHALGGGGGGGGGGYGMRLQMTSALRHSHQIIMKSLDPLRAKKTFIRKKLGRTAVSAIKASSVSDPINLARGARGKYCIFENFNMAVVSKTDISRNYQNISNL